MDEKFYFRKEQFLQMRFVNRKLESSKKSFKLKTGTIVHDDKQRLKIIKKKSIKSVVSMHKTNGKFRTLRLNQLKRNKLVQVGSIKNKDVCKPKPCKRFETFLLLRHQQLYEI